MNFVAKVLRYLTRLEKVTSIELISKSYKNKVFSVVLSSGDEFVVKLFSDRSYFNNRKNEVYYIDYLRCCGCNMPLPDVVFSGMIEGVLCTVEKKLGSYDLDDIYLYINNRYGILEELATYVSSVNSIRFESCGFFDSSMNVSGLENWNEYLAKEIQCYLKVVRQESLLSERIISGFDEYAEKMLSPMQKMSSFSFIHNDLCPCNIRIEKAQNGEYTVSGILDFELAMAGDPVKELCKLMWSVSLFPGMESFFLKKYAARMSLPDDFMEKIEFYECIARLKHLSLVNSYPQFALDGILISKAQRIVSNIVTNTVL